MCSLNLTLRWSSVLQHNHDNDFNDFTILCRDNNSFRPLLKESILIFRDSPVLNKNTKSILLLLFELCCLIYYQRDFFNFLCNIF